MSGIHKLIADQNFLNKINVYPVPDGDTGTNLSLSLGAALGVLQAPGEKHLGTMLAATADALLDGSRGNSGAILAQFFQGVSDSASDLSRFTTATFARAIRSGCDYAHDALSNPEEGTILSVIAAFAGAIEKHVNSSQHSDFTELFEIVMPKTMLALSETTTQLEALRKANVVDAGAKGFVDLASGIANFISHGEITPQPDMSALPLAEEMAMPADSDENLEYRYCTECIVAADEIDRRKLREALSTLGASLVIAGSMRKARIHIHCNDAQAVFDIARRFGSVNNEKADDLHRQQHSGRQRARKFAVITDSAADISDSDMERLDIHMVPCHIQIGDRGYLDKVTISNAEIFAALASGEHYPSTSQPAAGEFRRQFQYLASHYADVLSVNLSSAASGTCQAARSAAERTVAHGKVHVVDSRNASLGQGLLAVFAAECAAAGVSAQATLAALADQISQTCSYGVLSNLNYAVRGGRIPRWVKIVANTTRITPVIRTSPDGKIVLSACLPGRRNIARRFARHVAKQIRRAGYKTLVAVGHANNPGGAQLAESILMQQAPNIERLTHAELGTALGVHGGPGTLVIATQRFVSPEGLRD